LRGEVDEERNVVHAALRSARARSVPRHGRIDEHRPGVDAALKVVEIPEPVTAEIVGSVLAADAVMTLEDDRRVPIEEQQGVVIRLVEEAETVNGGDHALLLGPDVHALDGGAALEQRLQ